MTDQIPHGCYRSNCSDYSNGVSGIVLQHRVLHECNTRLDATDTMTPTTLPSLSSSIRCEGSDEGRVGIHSRCSSVISFMRLVPTLPQLKEEISLHVTLDGMKDHPTSMMVEGVWI